MLLVWLGMSWPKHGKGGLILQTTHATLGPFTLTCWSNMVIKPQNLCARGWASNHSAIQYLCYRSNWVNYFPEQGSFDMMVSERRSVEK